MYKGPELSRRRLFATAAGSVAAVGLAPRLFAQTPAPAPAPAPAAAPPATLPPYVSWKNADSMIIHTATTIETKRSALGSSVITPTDRLFIRNNLPAPDAAIVANRDLWQLAVEGVGSARSFSVAELKALGLETVAMVLQCSGNGRGYFANKPSGTPWQVGAAGCVIWSGVPVREVVAAVGGVAAGMDYMTSTGGETLAAGVDPLTVMVERSVPVDAMQDAILAWELNGEPLPLAHGGPLRLIVPGYSGVNNVKYVKRLAFTKEQSKAAIQNTGYRMTPPGGRGDPSQPSVWKMAAKSWINSPGPEGAPLKAGKLQIAGVAMGGSEAVAKVEVSTDGGKTWQTARLTGPDLGKYAWRQFVLSATLAAGSYDLASRVTDSTGKVQEEASAENASGYLNSGWKAHGFKITVA
ncbi:MAG: sulfite oxidase [Bauldia sp.]